MSKPRVIPFEKSFASSDKAQFWSSRNVLKPEEVRKSSNIKHWFECGVCGHPFDCSLNNVVGGKWCPYCAKNGKLCDDNNCKHCFENSFASSIRAINWSDRNRDQPEGYDGLYLPSRKVRKSSHSKFWFNCHKCGHSFDSGLNNVTKGHWCNYCSNHKLCDDNNCNYCFDKSFASNVRASNWSNKNKLKPREVFKSTHYKYLFDCECGHSFESVLSSITNGIWCRYCAEYNGILCHDNNCNKCFDKSFASNVRASNWSNKNKLKPRDVFKSTCDKYLFDCERGHSFESVLSSITKGIWCPYCVNKTEQILYDKLISLYPSLQQQFKVEWCKNQKHLPFDFVIPEYNIIIELDGPQHFIQISNWASPEETQENDKYKTECANQNNYSVIRLLQEDVFYNTYNWLDELNQNIQKIINEGITQNIYMCKNGEYDAEAL